MLDPGSTALRISDMQRDLVYLEKRWKAVSGIIEPLVSLKNSCLQAGVPVFYLNFSLHPDDEQFARFEECFA